MGQEKQKQKYFPYKKQLEDILEIFGTDIEGYKDVLREYAQESPDSPPLTPEKLYTEILLKLAKKNGKFSEKDEGVIKEALTASVSRDAMTGNYSRHMVPFLDATFYLFSTIRGNGGRTHNVKFDYSNIGNANKSLGRGNVDELIKIYNVIYQKRLEDIADLIVPVRNGGDEFYLKVILKKGIGEKNLKERLAEIDREISSLAREDDPRDIKSAINKARKQEYRGRHIELIHGDKKGTFTLRAKGINDDIAGSLKAVAAGQNIGEEKITIEKDKHGKQTLLVSNMESGTANALLSTCKDILKRLSHIDAEVKKNEYEPAREGIENATLVINTGGMHYTVCYAIKEKIKAELERRNIKIYEITEVIKSEAGYTGEHRNFESIALTGQHITPRIAGEILKSVRKSFIYQPPKLKEALVRRKLGIHVKHEKYPDKTERIGFGAASGSVAFIRGLPIQEMEGLLDEQIDRSKDANGLSNNVHNYVTGGHFGAGHRDWRSKVIRKLPAEYARDPEYGRRVARVIEKLKKKYGINGEIAQPVAWPIKVDEAELEDPAKDSRKLRIDAINSSDAIKDGSSKEFLKTISRKLYDAPDPISGLRIGRDHQQDLARAVEKNRESEKGYNFSFAEVEIFNIAGMNKHLGYDAANAMIGRMAGIIRDTLKRKLNDSVEAGIYSIDGVKTRIIANDVAPDKLREALSAAQKEIKKQVNDKKVEGVLREIGIDVSGIDRKILEKKISELEHTKSNKTGTGITAITFGLNPRADYSAREVTALTYGIMEFVAHDRLTGGNLRDAIIHMDGRRTLQFSKVTVDRLGVELADITEFDKPRRQGTTDVERDRRITESDLRVHESLRKRPPWSQMR